MVSGFNINRSNNILLSVCMTGRNDTYCGNFKYRLETALNYLAINANHLNIQHNIEIVITDWNSRERLGDALNLNSEAVQLCRFIYVPPVVARQHNPAQRDFNTALSVNVAIRRATGRFLMFMPCDILFPMAGLKNLMDLLQGKLSVPIDLDAALMLVCRKFIPWQFIDREPNIETVEKYLAYNAWQCSDPPTLPGLNAHMGAVIMSRCQWRATKGLDEVLTKWGWSDIELGLRVNQLAPSICLSHFGIHCYEMDSTPQARNETLVDKNPTHVSTTTEANGDNWGLGDIHLESYQGKGRSHPDPIEDHYAIPETELLKKFSQVPAIPNLVRYFGPNIRKHPHWAVIYMLAYHMTHFKPHYYIDYSILRGPASYVAPLLDPSIYLVGINDCSGSTSGQALADTLAYFRNKLSYTGHFHLVSGSIRSAIQRLALSVKIASRYDLVNFLPDLFQHGFKQQIDRLLPMISGNGAVVYSSKDDSLFKEVTHYIDGLGSAMFSMKSYKYRTGIVVNANLSSSERRVLQPSSEELYVNSILET